MNFSTLKKDYKNFVHIISEKWKTNPELQEKTTIKIIEDYKDFIEKCEELQESNWVLTTLETKVSSIKNRNHRINKLNLSFQIN